MAGAPRAGPHEHEMHSHTHVKAGRTGSPADGSTRVLVAAPTAADTAELSFVLLAGGYRVSTAVTLAEAVQLLQGERPAAWLLDARLLSGHAEPSGPDWLRRLAGGVPIILHFPRGASARERMAALERGVDAVISGAIEQREMLLHVAAAVRRTTPARPRLDTPPLVCVDEQAHEASVLGERIHLTPLEFAVLRLLVRHAGRLLSHDALKAAAWGHPGAATDHALREHVRRLRAKLGPAAECLETVWGTGFRFRWPEPAPRDSRDASVAKPSENGDG